MNSKPKRRSLKDCLKVILQPRRDGSIDTATIATTILRHNDPSSTLLPSFSSVSLLPQIQSNQYDKSRSTASAPGDSQPLAFVPWQAPQTEDNPSDRQLFTDTEFRKARRAQAQLSELAGFTSPTVQRPRQYQIGQPSHQRLHSLSSVVNLDSVDNVTRIVASKPIEFNSPLSRIVETCSVPSIYRHGASQHASLANITTSRYSTSTLRLRPSTRTLQPLPSPTAFSSSSTHSLRQFALPHDVDLSPKLRSLRRKASSRSIVSIGSTRTATPSLRNSALCLEVEAGLSCINHFASFAVLDASEPACPITALSGDLRDSLTIGDQFCLDPKGVTAASMDTVTGFDSEGNEIVHLLLYSPLLRPSSGRNRFVLVSFLDVTEFIKDTANLPELDFMSEESIMDEEVITPRRSAPINSPKYELLPEDLLGGCYVPERRSETPVGPDKHDIWLDIASEESKRSESKHSNRGSSTPRSSSSIPSSLLSVQNLLDQFLLSLQELYADFFVLGTSPFDECAYEICNVSPRVYASRDYIEGHLSKTPAEDKVYLETKLTEENPFRVPVRWGNTGELKQLYCIPLFGRISVTWVCFLVQGDQWASVVPMW